MKLNKNNASVMIGMALSLSAISGSVQAHGWAEFPSARQNTCYNDGGYWSNQIPNAACQQAYDKSGVYPFLQRNEVAALTQDYNNIDAVKAQVPNGELCSAGDAQKAGLNIPSSEWQTTDIVLDENGEFDFVWTATAPHNPSFWEFYLSKPSYDGTSPLTWDDVELIQETGNVEPTAGSPYKTYRIKVALPQDRIGSNAVLYTRWQRIDPAGEGFYNCSDIVIKKGDGEVTPPPAEGNLTPLHGYFVPAGYPTPNVGDTARFRLMEGASGSEMYDERLVITAANQATWAADLAAQVNAQQPENLFVGVWNAANGIYEFDHSNVHANKVWVAKDGYSFAVSFIEGEVEPPVEPPVDPELPEGTWDKSATYVAGDVVTHAGKTWTAGWWTQGEEPGIAQVWKHTPGEGEVPSVDAWSAEKSYNENDVVTHNGDSWKAHWWTQGEEPGTTGEWGVWRKL